MNIEEIIKGQRDFFNTGKTLPVAYRIEALKRLKQVIRDNEEEINKALLSDLGKSSSETFMCETGLTLSEITYLLKKVRKFARPKRVHTTLVHFHAVSYEVNNPYGVVLIMSPWNYPFMLTMEPLVGAIAAGKKAIGKHAVISDSKNMGFKQACAAIGQARLMMTYQKLFSEYNHMAAQILMTKNTVVDDINRTNAYNTFTELLNMGVIPIVNENDTVSTYEIVVGDDDVLIGDNDTLSAIVASLVKADLLILLSDIDGLYTDDPRKNSDAKFISQVDALNDDYMNMGKASTGSSVGTGGMNTKMNAAKIATSAGADMIIANGSDMRILHRIMDGRTIGTLFKANPDDNFDMIEYINHIHD